MSQGITKLTVAGWNAFGQWLPSSQIQEISSFTTIDTAEYFPTKAVETSHMGIEWAYNVIITDSKVFIKGFYQNELDASSELCLPNGFIFTHCACNDQYILFYNSSEKYVWKYSIDPDTVQDWKLLPNFIDTEREICDKNVGDIDNVNIKSSESITKIVCSVRMNVALSSSGRLFNIPYEISRSQVKGKIADIQCGYEHGILLTDSGSVYTWGGGSRCQLGHGSTDSYDEPELVVALDGIPVKKISAGGWHCCVISVFGDLYTWGWNDKSQLGVYINTLEDRNNECTEKTEDSKSSECKQIDEDDSENDPLPNYSLPILIDIHDQRAIVERNVIDVSCGSKHTIVKLDDNSFWGSGCNKFGQLGLDKTHSDIVKYFTRLGIKDENFSIQCGPWSTALIS